MNRVDSAEPLLVDVQQAAKMVGIGRSKLYELVRKGQIPVVHIGRSVRVPVSALHDFVSRLLAEQEGEA